MSIDLPDESPSSMTELIWETSTDPFVLLDYLFPVRGQDSAEPQTRRSQLYLLACARQAWDQLPWAGRALVEVAERMVVSREDVGAACRSIARAAAENLTHCRGEVEALADIERMLNEVGITRPDGTPRPEVDHDPATWQSLAHLVYYPFAGKTPYYGRIAAGYHSVALIREVFGNPFYPVSFDPHWLTQTVVALTREIVAKRDFGTLPLLADALQDAGCDKATVFEHCRADVAHVRGCWVLEGILHRARARGSTG